MRGLEHEQGSVRIARRTGISGDDCRAQRGHAELEEENRLYGTLVTWATRLTSISAESL